MNRPLMGDPTYPIFYVLRDCIWERTGNIQQIVDCIRAHKLGIVSYPRVQASLNSLINRGFVETYVGTNPHTGNENETLYRVVT